jgi:site-specific DNA recombinase
MDDQAGGDCKRCAIYTRRSVEGSVEREINSLETQREVCSAYIKCNTHRGWVELPDRYDDDGFSARDMQRPAIERLFADVEEDRVDVIVFYKIDRFTRSLKDFVRLVDTLEARNVSLVSVTQSFDTATSLGRLTLNILLTFAQFERELLSDRIKDSLNALRSRGLPLGAQPPIGYNKVKGRYVVNQREAVTVRDAFRLMPQMRNVHELAKYLQAAGVCSKRQVSKIGKVRGGKPICSATVYRMLRNPLYLGRYEHKGRWYEGQHEAIVTQAEWDTVQKILQQRREKRLPRDPSRNILLGILYDCFGRRLILECPMDRSRNRHRYYASCPMEKSRALGQSRLRVDADRAEEFTCLVVRSFLQDRLQLSAALLEGGLPLSDTEHLVEGGGRAMTRAELRRFYEAILRRGEISDSELRLFVDCVELRRFLNWDGRGQFNRLFRKTEVPPTYLLRVPAQLVRTRPTYSFPIVDRDDKGRKPSRKLVNLLNRGFAARGQVLARRDCSIAQIAHSTGMNPSYFCRLLRLNYLAPDIQTSIFDGTQPLDLTLQKLVYSALPLDWELQRQLLGFPSP